MPLTASKFHIDGWRSVHLDPNEPGSSGHLGQIESYVINHMATANVSYFEGYPDLFSAATSEMIVHSW